MQLLKYVANAMQRAEGFVLERALVIIVCVCVLVHVFVYVCMHVTYIVLCLCVCGGGVCMGTSGVHPGLHDFIKVRNDLAH